MPVSFGSQNASKTTYSKSWTVQEHGNEPVYFPRLKSSWTHTTCWDQPHTDGLQSLQPSSDDGLRPNSDGLQPNSEGLQPNSDSLQPNSNGLQPDSDGLQPNCDGLQPNSDGLQPDSDGFQPDSDGLQPDSDGLQPKSDGLQPDSDGLQPKSDGLQPDSDGLQPNSDVFSRHFNSPQHPQPPPSDSTQFSLAGRPKATSQGRSHIGHGFDSGRMATGFLGSGCFPVGVDGFRDLCMPETRAVGQKRS